MTRGEIRAEKMVSEITSRRAREQELDWLDLLVEPLVLPLFEIRVVVLLSREEQITKSPRLKEGRRCLGVGDEAGEREDANCLRRV